MSVVGVSRGRGAQAGPPPVAGLAYPVIRSESEQPLVYRKVTALVRSMEIAVSLVRRLVSSQFPEWADLPVAWGILHAT